MIDIEQYVDNAETVKDMVLKRLKAEDYITEDQCNYLQIKYQLGVVKRGWFKSAISRLQKEKQSNEWTYVWLKDLFQSSDPDAEHKAEVMNESIKVADDILNRISKKDES